MDHGRSKVVSTQYGGKSRLSCERDSPPVKSFHKLVFDFFLVYDASVEPFVQLHDLVVFHVTLTGRQKAASALVFAEADKALCDGADEELWVLEVALRVHKAVSS